ncbi:MAG TPA: hypothetical protein VGT05_04270 [Patescibacteria group bacterium]|nr:hypothetical protein [Patescibacteria group bacterium]
MGKIRAKTIGDEGLEKQQKVEDKKRRKAKKVAKGEEQNAQREVNTVTDRIETGPLDSITTKHPESIKTSGQTDQIKGKRKLFAKKAVHSAKYFSVKKLIEKHKMYSAAEAIELLEKTHLAKFDETVELHINTTDKGISGNVVLPHGTGKKTRIAIIAPSKNPSAADELLKQIESGKITFDMIIATPDAMPRLGKVAKILGPKGLMPNPKNGTISPNPEELAKKYENGQLYFKTENAAPVLHVVIGKLSFGKEKLSDNLEAVIRAIQAKNIRNVTIKSTMSPGVKLLIR